MANSSRPGPISKVAARAQCLRRYVAPVTLSKWTEVLVDCLHQIEFAWVVELKLRRSLWRATPLHLGTPHATLGRSALAKRLVGREGSLDWPVQKRAL
jgi:hypothetical protein